MYSEIENFLPNSIAENIENVLLSGYFPWYYSGYVSANTEAAKLDLQEHYFLHQFFRDTKINSEYFELIVPILERLNIKTIIRAKANLYTNIGKFKKFGWHRDTIGDSKTAIYYVNNNNGYTGLENKIQLNSKKNKLILLDNNYSHYGTNCTDEKVRCVININYQ